MQIQNTNQASFGKLLPVPSNVKNLVYSQEAQKEKGLKGFLSKLFAKPTEDTFERIAREEADNNIADINLVVRGNIFSAEILVGGEPKWSCNKNRFAKDFGNTIRRAQMYAREFEARALDDANSPKQLLLF